MNVAAKLLGSLFAVIAGGWTAHHAIAVQDDAKPTRPHIVILLVDDMGYGDPGCYNSDSKIATPHIDSLARDGMRFTDAHAPGPLCHMSRYGLLTGMYPFRIDVSRWPTQPLIGDAQTTIATLAQSAGYATAMVGKWHVGFEEKGYDQPLRGGPVDRGFDQFFGIRASTDIPPYFYIRDRHAVTPPINEIAASNSEDWSPIQGKFWRAGGIAPDLQLDDVLPRFTNEAISVIEQHDKTSPLMLYLAYPAPHTPWLPSAEFAGKSQADLYGDFATMVDDEIGKVLKSLDDARLANDTLLILTSDNGPCWYEADVQRTGHASAGELRGMKADAWEGGHRMPFIVRWPNHVRAGMVNNRTICFTDLLATFADVMGRKLVDDEGVDSISFYESLVRAGQKVTPQPPRSPMVMQTGSAKHRMIRSGDWKYITALGSGGFSPPKTVSPKPGEAPGQLYNLKQDLGETTNLYAQHPEIVERLLREMGQIVDAGRSRPVD